VLLRTVTQSLAADGQLLLDAEDRGGERVTRRA